MEKLSDEQVKFFINSIEFLENKLSYPIAPVREAELYWEPKYEGGATLASFSQWSPKRIKISTGGKMVPEMMLATVIHELRHMYQFQKYGRVLFSLASIPIIRMRLLETSAWNVEREAEGLLGQTGLNNDEMGIFM